MARERKFYNFKPSAETLHTWGEEPEWTELPTDAQRRTKMITALNWYNYACDSKDARRFFEDWIHTQRGDTAEEDLAVLARAADRHLTQSMAHLARMATRGFPLTEEEQSRIWASIQAAAARRVDAEPTGAAVTAGAAAAERVSVQDRIDNQVLQALDDIEDLVSALLRGSIREARTQSIGGFTKFSAVHFTRIVDALPARMAELWELRDLRAAGAQDDHGAQLIEGYRFVTAKSLKAAVAFVDECLALAGRMAIERKVARVRRAKPVDRVRLVRKLRYMPTHPELKLTSIRPLEVLGSSELWVYDTRKRKLGVIRGEFSGSIMVKGASYTGVNATQCVQKTLRRPEAQLAEFMKLGKNQLRKWFDSIKSVQTQLKARSNEHSVLLRVS